MRKTINKIFAKGIDLLQQKRKELRQSCYSNDLERNQHLSSEQLENLQWKRLKKLLAHAYENVPHYQRQFNKLGITPSDVRDIKDFQKLPFLRKSDIQQMPDDFLAVNYDKDKLKKDATGGSTGQPLIFYRDQICHEWTWKAFERFRNWIGYSPIDKLALIWGADRDIPSSYPSNQRWLNSFNYSSDDIEAFIQELIQWKPRAIRGYASSLFLVASYIKQHNLTAPRPVAIESSAEKLWAYQRTVIEDVFNCPVYDQYGSREIPSIACECEFQTGLHIFSDIRLVEIIRNGESARQGEEGSIVITDLLNFGMPFIRYEIGDVGVMSDLNCSCGRGFPLLKEVKGRISSTIITSQGRFVHGEYFTHLFYPIQGVTAFQVHQGSIDAIEVHIQPGNGFDSSVMPPLLSEIKDHLGPEMAITWHIVEEIPLTPTGKHHFVISDIPVDFVVT
jgi:phenylacetate-CoA ligase